MTDVVSDPTSLTKDKLKKELMKRNVTLPATDKRKDVYVQLYREHVLGNLASFSSDEEDSFGGSKLTQRKGDTETESKPGSPRKSTSKKSSASSAAMDPFKLSDEELKDELNKRGVNAGPILDSTRKVYQRKLDRLLKEAPAKAEPVVVLAEEEEEEEEFSESEEEPEPETQVKQIVEPKVDSIRKRQTRDSPKPPSRTLTPRRSTRIEAEKPPSVKVVNDVVIEERKVAPPPPRTDTVTRQPERNSGTTTAPVPKKRAFSIKVQLAILVIVALVIFFVITKMEPSYRNPLRRAVSGGSGEV